MEVSSDRGPVTERAAVTIARRFLRQHGLDGQFGTFAPFIRFFEGAYLIEFADPASEWEPGVVIVAVDARSGEPRFEPVE